MARTDRAALEIVRVVVGIVVLSHPLYDVFHPAVVDALGRSTPALGLPSTAGVVLAWAGVLLQLVAAVALLARRRVDEARAVLVVLIGISAVLYQWPDWYVVGGSEVTGHPGVELSVVLIALLAARDPRAMDVVRITVALVLMLHGGVVLVKFEAAGMRAFGEQMEEAGFPFGVALVWTVVTIQGVAAATLLLRRLIVPSCAAQIFLLVNGIWTTHAPFWFVVGPGRSASRGWSPASGPDEGGMELSVLLIAGFAAVLLAHLSTSASPSPSQSALPSPSAR